MTNLSEQLNSHEILMETAIKKHFVQSRQPEFSEELFRKIIAGINREQRAQFLRKLKIRLWTVAGFLAMTLFLFAVALETSLKAFAQTPTYNFISLMFMVMIFNSKEY